MRGAGTVYSNNGSLWIQFWHEGRCYRESAKTKNRTEAGKLLRQKLADLQAGRAMPDSGRLTVASALDAYLDDVKTRRGDGARKSAAKKLKPLREGLGTVRLSALKSPAVSRYAAARRKSVGPATVNRERAYLKASLRLAVAQDMIARVPKITMEREPDARRGFVEPAEVEVIIAALPEHARDAVRFAYATGWRRSEVLSLTWESVHAGEVRLARTKNGRPRTLQLVEGDEVAAIIERCRATRTLACPLVFHREDGAPVQLRNEWKAAVTAAGRPGLLVHDLRRSAVRNMVRAGVPESHAMSISGHLTASIFRRYDIVAGEDQAAALAKAAEYRAKERAKAPTVVPIAR